MADTLVSGSLVYVHDNAQATATQIGRAGAAFAAFTTSSIDALITSRVDIYFTKPSDMANIPGLTSAAWGYTKSGSRICYVNSTLNAAQTKYVCVHELFHMVDHDTLNASDRAALMAIMDPTATSWNQDDGTSGNTAYRHHPSECFADQGVAAYTSLSEAPLQSSSGGNYYYRQIDPSDYGTYRSIVGGSSGPASVTLAADAFFLDTSVSFSGFTGFSDGDWFQINDGNTEQCQISSHSGSGPYTVNLVDPLAHNHSSGTPVVEIAPPSDPGGPSDRQTTAIGIAGSDYTLQIDADSVKATESGASFNGTFTFTIRVDPNSETDMEFDDSFPWADVYWTFNNYVLFGGVFMGATRRHGVAGDIYYDCRCVSYDSWLDRRSLWSPNPPDGWWTTDDRTVSGTPMVNDDDIVKAVIADAAPFLDTGSVHNTNTAMPQLELPEGTIRDAISRIAEQAATSGDSDVRRVYVDFDQVVHYFKGDEGVPAIYTIQDSPAVGALVPDYIEYDIDYNDSGEQVLIHGTGFDGTYTLAGIGGPYVANTIINRPEVTDLDTLHSAGVGFITRDFSPKEMVKFVVQGYVGWRAEQTVTIADAGLGVSGDYQIRSIVVTPSPGGNDQITFEITAGASPWSGILDMQRKAI